MQSINIKKLFWLFPFIVFACGYFIPYFFLKHEAYETPNIMGKSVHEALKIISPLHINSRVIYYKQDDTLPAGTVISQVPTPGQKIKAHQTIFLTLSQKSKPLTTADYTGKKINSEEENTFKKLGIYYQKVPVFSLAPEETCIAQHPQPESINKEKRLILYSAQHHKPIVLMPDLIGQPLQAVEDFLDNHNVPYKIVTTSFVFEWQNSYVIEQRPLAGTLIDLTTPHPVTIKI